MNILSKIKKLMTNEEELLKSSAPEQEELTQEVERVLERCGCPENNKFTQEQLGERCMFCGKEFYSTN